MSTVQLVRRPQSVESYTGRTSVLAVAYDEMSVAYVDKAGELQPAAMDAGMPCIGVAWMHCHVALILAASGYAADLFPHACAQLRRLEPTYYRPPARR